VTGAPANLAPQRAVCEECGSFNLVRARSTWVDRGLSHISGRRPIFCRRCGWRARRAWTEENIVGPHAIWEDDGTEPWIPNIDEPAKEVRRTRKKSSAGKRARKGTTAKADRPAEFDLRELPEEVEDAVSIELESRRPIAEPIQQRFRARRRRRRMAEIITTVAISVLVTLMVSAFITAEGCNTLQ
jgi:hypothetical protein